MESFISNMLIAAKQVAILYILVAVGFFCDKAGIYKEKAARLTNDLVFYIVTPAVIINSFMSIESTPENLKRLLTAILFGGVLQLTATLISIPFFRKKDKPDNCIYKFASIYGNVGYMALPLANALLGAEGVFFCSAVVMVFNVCTFTHGIRVMSKEGKFDYKKLVLNPGTIAVIIGLPLFLLKVKLPEIASSPLNYLASLNTPLAMIIFGTYLANTDLKTMFKDKNIFLVALLKLVALPMVMLCIFRAVNLSEGITKALVISSSAPSANITVMFSAKYDKDVGTASKTVAVVSFISIITMPVMIALSQI